MRKAERGYTEPGLPRPADQHGRPIPWNSDADNLGLRHMDRTKRTSGGTICQVCGLRVGETAIAFGTRDPSGQIDPAEGEHVPEGWFIHAMDHGLVHVEVCARLALDHCPGLKRLARAGELVAFEGPSGSIEFGPEGVRRALASL